MKKNRIKALETSKRFGDGEKLQGGRNKKAEGDKESAYFISSSGDKRHQKEKDLGKKITVT